MPMIAAKPLSLLLAATACAIVAGGLAAGPAGAQATGGSASAPAGAASGGAAAQPSAPAKAPDSLVILFDSGSAALRPEDRGVLDQASRLFREGNPIVMIVSGSTDGVGSPELNLRLSQQRAETVLRGLVARGIPADRFQILAKGETEPAVPAPKGTAEPQNRRVEIRWR
jgi:OOP family OmpA-OmpF porin